MSKAERRKAIHFSNSRAVDRYLGYKTDYNDDLFYIVDTKKDAIIADNLIYHTCKDVIDELNKSTATLQELKERVRKREEELQRIIGADEYSNQYLAVKESRIDELKRVNETIEELQDE